MRRDSVLNLEKMRKTLLLIQNIAAQSKVPEEVAKWTGIVRENRCTPVCGFTDQT
jgi:hypothetical protein